MQVGSANDAAVRMSQEVRARSGEAQARAAPERTSETEREPRPGERPRPPSPVLAARVGFAPLVPPAESAIAADDALRAALREHARLLDLGPVLAQPSSLGASPEPASPLLAADAPGERRAPAPHEAELMPPLRGEADAESTRQTQPARRPFRGEPRVALATPDPAPPSPVPAPNSEAERAAVDRRHSEDRAVLWGAALAPHGAAPRESAERRARREVDASAENGALRRAPLREERARAHFSQARAVLADSPEDLVARFADEVRREP